MKLYCERCRISYRKPYVYSKRDGACSSCGRHGYHSQYDDEGGAVSSDYAAVRQPDNDGPNISDAFAAVASMAQSFDTSSSTPDTSSSTFDSGGFGGTDSFGGGGASGDY
jgi:hypothetical protein